MPDNPRPRHTLRAQGRAQLGERATFQPLRNAGGKRQSESSADRNSSAASPPREGATEKQYSRLLDYLSQSAAGTDRTILDHASTDAVVSSSSAAQLLEAWFNAGSNKTQYSSTFGTSQTAAGSRASDQDTDEDLDDSLESTNSEGYWPGDMYQSLRESESNAGRYPGNYSGGYFGTDSFASGSGRGAARNERIPSRRVQREIEGRPGAAPGGPGAYLRRLRHEVEKASTPQDMFGGDGVSDRSGVRISRCGAQVEVREEASGSRVETFPSGARVFKDGLGHVREIVSAGGVTVSFKYNEQGHLSAFVRTDAGGTIHSLAEADRHGVILRDASGRVKAQGESMQVDACGCVSIARQDGQFWSLDLVRNVNIERRLLPDEYGNWFSMTALFSSDGFRMATRFRKVKAEDLPIGQAMNAGQSLPAGATIGGAMRGADVSARFDGASVRPSPDRALAAAPALTSLADALVQNFGSGSLADASKSMSDFSNSMTDASKSRSDSSKSRSDSSNSRSDSSNSMSDASKLGFKLPQAPARLADGTIATLAPGRIDFLSEEDSGNYRFYGRDGSIIDFASDDELKQLKPSCVLPAGARAVVPGHRGKRQAGTAWEALREYVFNYLAAL